MTDELGGRLTDGLDGKTDGRTGRRIEETDGLNKTTGGMTDTDGQADRWTGEGRMVGLKWKT